MARNKITFEYEHGDDHRNTYYFTGSIRQPTLVEIMNFIMDNHLQDEIDDYFGVAPVNMKNQEYRPPEENLTVILYGYDGGNGDGSCPICGHERDMTGEFCPVCEKRW